MLPWQQKDQINDLKWTGPFYSQYDPLENVQLVPIPNTLDQFTTSLIGGRILLSTDSFEKQ